MLDWLVVADDRTGALEVAGEMAATVGPVEVIAGSESWTPTRRAAVVDVGSRHLGPDAAADRAAASAVMAARHRAHKIDSTLRGRWAFELVAVRQVTGERVLVVPALPQLGRTCVGGTVHVDGEPLQLDDPRHGSVIARPVQLLVEAGAGSAASLATVGALRKWLADTDGEPFAVCDATSDDDLAAIARAWAAHRRVVFAGTSASVAAAVAATATRVAATAAAPVASAVPCGAGTGSLAIDLCRRPALVVVGSLHPVARAQLAALRGAALDGVELLATEPTDGAVDAPAADRAAALLAGDALTHLAGATVATLLIVGGDTAAAVLGDRPMVVGGTVATGIPWARRADGSGPLVVTKAGGFGGPSTLVDLLGGHGGEVR